MQEEALPFWRNGGFRRLASRDAPIAGRAQCQSARYAPRRPQAPCCARDRKGVGHCGATTEPPPSQPHCDRGALPTTGGTNQVHQMFHVKHPYWFPCLTHVSDKPSCSVSAQFSPKCCGFAARGSAQGDETNDDLGKRSLSGKARGLRGPHPQHLGENRTSGCTWMSDAASASHSIVRRPRRPPSDRRMFHVKHSFVTWGGA